VFNVPDLRFDGPMLNEEVDGSIPPAPKQRFHFHSLARLQTGEASDWGSLASAPSGGAGE